MRVLVAPDAFGDLLSSTEVARALAAGWASTAPADALDLCPMSDGGAGFLDAVTYGGGPLGAAGPLARPGDVGGRPEVAELTVSGPWGDVTPATVVVRTDPDGVRTAYVEAGQACGAHLAGRYEADGADDAAGRRLLRASSSGVGELLVAALDTGADRIVVGCGPAASHDGGAGALAVLGAGPVDLLGRGGGALTDLPDDALAGLAQVRERFRGVDLVAATDRTVPLLGFHGASATDAQDRGATADQAQLLEGALGRWADVAQRSLVAGRPLSGRGQAGEPGSGAAGGLAFALLLLGARRIAGAQAVAQAVGLTTRLSGCELVLSAERCFDRHSLTEQVVTTVSAAGLERGLPTVVVAGVVELGRREALAMGIAATAALADRPDRIPVSGAEIEDALRARSRRLARTWSPRLV